MPTLVENFEKFHADNPQVYDTLVRLAREWKSSTGRKKIGIGALTERARWDLALTTAAPDYKIANAHRAFYARMIMMQNRDLRGMFDLAASEADWWMWKKWGEIT